MSYYGLIIMVMLSLGTSILRSQEQQIELKDGAYVVMQGTWWALPTIDSTGSSLTDQTKSYMVDTKLKLIKSTADAQNAALKGTMKPGCVGLIGPQIEFENIGMVKNSLTAPSGSVLYKNYIGTLPISKTKRLDFCDDVCIERKKSKGKRRNVQ